MRRHRGACIILAGMSVASTLFRRKYAIKRELAHTSLRGETHFTHPVSCLTFWCKVRNAISIDEAIRKSQTLKIALQHLTEVPSTWASSRLRYRRALLPFRAFVAIKLYCLYSIQTSLAFDGSLIFLFTPLDSKYPPYQFLFWAFPKSCLLQNLNIERY